MKKSACMASFSTEIVTGFQLSLMSELVVLAETFPP
jgi:hypothetical protein